MNRNLFVTKRDGRKERIDTGSWKRYTGCSDWAAEGLHNVSVSQVELRSHIQFYDGIRTADIHETIIRAAADLDFRPMPLITSIWQRVWRFSTCVKRRSAGSSNHRNCMTMWSV